MIVKLRSGMVVAAFILAGWHIACAQIPVRIGIQSGINSATESFSPDNVPSKAHRLGFIIGGTAELGLAGLLSLQAEPLFIQKGITYLSSVNNNPEAYNRLSYIELALLLKGKLRISDDVNPVIFLGPSVGWLISAIYADNEEDKEGVDIRKYFNSFDFSMDMGAGVEYHVTRGASLIASSRYSLGLTDISNHDIYFYHQTRSMGIQFTLGILFNI